MAEGFTLHNTDFSAEFANFANFIGPAELQEAVNRVATKLGPLPPAIIALYLDRYFFHTYCIMTTDGPKAFQLDTSDRYAVRFASFIAGVNRMRGCLSSSGASRLRSMILGALRPDRDIRQLEHEVRTFVHFGQKKIATTLADLEQVGQFDMLCRADGDAFEVECKTVTEDTGEQVKTDLLVSLSDVFRTTLNNVDSLPGSGVYILTFAKSPSLCQNLHPALRKGLSASSLPLRSGDFDLTFEPRPEWDNAMTSAVVSRDLEALSRKWFLARFGDKMLGLALRPHKPSSLSDKIISTLKEAADQCSGSRPSVLWLHLIGHAEDEFREVAKFSQKGDGAGLNAIVANVLHPRASQTDRSHVVKIRFSADPANITQGPVLDADLMIRKANSLGGPCYDVPNPFSRFRTDIDA
jgi:hypothetical protein